MIFIFLFVLGLVEAVAMVILVPRLLQNQNISGDFRQLLTDLKADYDYSDSAALSQQATENLLNGQTLTLTPTSFKHC